MRDGLTAVGCGAMLGSLYHRKPERVDARLRVRLPVSMKVGAKQLSAYTENVSYRGLLIRPSSAQEGRYVLPLPQRAFVRMRVGVPGMELEVALSGMVIHGPTSERELFASGIGVQLYGNDASVLSEWSAFIASIKPVYREVPRRPKVTVTPTPLDEADKRRHARIASVLVIRYESKEEMMMMLTRDLSRGGMFLVTDCSFDVGETLVLDIYPLHPAEPYRLKAVVRRVAQEPGSWGIGVELAGMSEAERAQMWAYLFPDGPSSPQR